MCDKTDTVRLSTCLACSGLYVRLTYTSRPGEYGQYLCRHCQEGMMDADQVSSYLTRLTEEQLLVSLDRLMPQADDLPDVLDDIQIADSDIRALDEPLTIDLPAVLAC